MQGDIPQSNVLIVERLVIHQEFAERKGKFERHILRRKKNQRRIFRRSPNEGFPIGDFKCIQCTTSQGNQGQRFLHI
jgi:hypothetical protein